MKIFIKDFFSKCNKTPQETADLVTLHLLNKFLIENFIFVRCKIKHSRKEKVKLFKTCLSQLLLSQFSNALIKLINFRMAGNVAEIVKKIRTILNVTICLSSEEVFHRCSLEKLFYKYAAKLQENIHCHLLWFAANLVNSFFVEQLWRIASISFQQIYHNFRVANSSLSFFTNLCILRGNSYKFFVLIFQVELGLTSNKYTLYTLTQIEKPDDSLCLK